ncbi:MAG: hypothetical protein ABEJ36_05325 [Candidatus Nanosalina sp.]
MDNLKIASSVIKGLIGGGIAVTLTLLFHGLVIPTSDLPYVLLAVVVGSFISAFFAEYTGKIVCEDEEEDKKDQYIAISSVFFILGVINVMDNKIASAGWIIASLLLAVAAYRESDKNIREVLRIH